MERLVIRIGNEPAVPTEFDMDFAFDLDKGTFDGLQRIFDQLCDLTDILGDEYDLDRLQELKQADDEGRCVVLPAKPDQTIYQWRKGDDCPSVSRLDGVQISGDGEITYPIWCGHLTPGDFGETVFLTREEAALRREQE